MKTRKRPRAVPLPKPAINPFKLDPTRTSVLRTKFVADLVRRFKRLSRSVIRLVDTEDAFGLKPKPHTIASIMANTRWQFNSSPEKVRAFQDWLRSQFDKELLGADDAALWEKYIQQGFEKGMSRAFDDARKAARFKKGEGAFYRGTKQQFLRDSFRNPVTVDKVKLLAGRTYSDLVGITDGMSQLMTRTLTDGLVAGLGPREIARGLAKTIDGIGRNRAVTIARTEIVRAHAEGQLHALEHMGVEEVGVAVEWSTAGDYRVCELCSSLEGVVLKLSEARGMIPRHPNCRCAWLPANVGEKDKGRKTTQQSIKKAIQASKSAEKSTEKPGPTSPGATTLLQEVTSGWGPGKAISSSRPESPLKNELTTELLEFSDILRVWIPGLRKGE